MSPRTESPAVQPASGYWAESARPLASLAFVAPLLVAYEVGVLWLGPAALRNAADLWLRRLLDRFGFTQYFLLPVVACGLLLAWHHIARQPWRLRSNVLVGMLIESLVFGFLLVVVAGWQSQLLSSAAAVCAASEPRGQASVAALVVAYLGAGIYEEVLFRLLLLTAAGGICRWAGMSWRTSWLAAAAAISLLFAAAHYQLDFTLLGWHWATAHGEVFAWSTFTFRLLAGLTFSALFLLRGFGVTVGTHAAYDLFTLLA